MSSEIYIVYGSTGEYSDHREWPVAAFASESAARAKVLRCVERVRLYKDADKEPCSLEFRARRARRESLDVFKDEDPGLQVDYTGTTYDVWTVPFIAGDAP